jgi:hypothetical protein
VLHGFPVISALYGKPVCNLIGLAFDSSPLNRLVVVAAPQRQFSVTEKDDDITFRNAIVASYANLGRVRCYHDFNLAERGLFVAITIVPTPGKSTQFRSRAASAAGSPFGGPLGLI